MLTKVTVVPPAGAYWPSFEIPVLAPDSSGIFIEKVDGLEPVAATISTNAYNELDGEFYVGSVVGKRNIVLHCLMEPGRDQSVSDLRRKLYGYFMPKLPVTLQFDFTDRDPVQITGYSESYQGDRWSTDPDAQISIICPMPYFALAQPLVVNGQSVIGSDPPFIDVLNEGDQAVGVSLRIVNNSGVDFDGDVKIDRKIESSPGVYYSSQEMYAREVYLPVRHPSQYMAVDTNPGKKRIAVLDASDDDSMVDNLLGRTNDDLSWLSFYPGLNKFRVVTTNTTDWTTHHLTLILTLIPLFGGL